MKDRLLLLRKTLCLKQVDFAAALCVSNGNVGDWERGKAKPGADALATIVKAFNVNAMWLLTGEGEMFQQEQLEPLPLVMDFEINELDAEQKELLMMFEHLGADGKYAVKDFARYQLEMLPRNAPIERPKRAEKSPCFRPSGNPKNGVDSA